MALSFAKAGASPIALGDIGDFGDLEQDLIAAAAENGHSSPPKVLLLKLDVTDHVQVAAAAAKVKEVFNRKLDILIHNAGVMSPRLLVVDFDEKSWLRTIAVNLEGVFLVSKYFVPLLQESEGGLKTMVNLNSVASVGLRPCSSDYATSKAAVLKFTEMLLVEEAEKGLLAFSVHPGGVMSKMSEVAFPKELWHLFEDQTQLAGDTIAWLTQVRREWLAGRWLSCNWDMEELLNRRTEIEDGDKLKMRLVM